MFHSASDNVSSVPGRRIAAALTSTLAGPSAFSTVSDAAAMLSASVTSQGATTWRLPAASARHHTDPAGKAEPVLRKLFCRVLSHRRALVFSCCGRTRRLTTKLNVKRRLLRARYAAIG